MYGVLEMDGAPAHGSVDDAIWAGARWVCGDYVTVAEAARAAVDRANDVEFETRGGERVGWTRPDHRVVDLDHPSGELAWAHEWPADAIISALSRGEAILTVEGGTTLVGHPGPL